MMRGAFEGAATADGYGPVKVFEDLDTDARVHILTVRDEWHFIARSRVTFTPPKGNENESDS